MSMEDIELVVMENFRMRWNLNYLYYNYALRYVIQFFHFFFSLSNKNLTISVGFYSNFPAYV